MVTCTQMSLIQNVTKKSMQTDYFHLIILLWGKVDFI